MFLFNLLEGEPKTDYTSFIVIGIIIVAFIVMTVISNKNRKKQMVEDQKRKDSLCAGTKIITIGGIRGKIVKTKDDSIVIQVGADKVKFEMMRWAVSSVTKSSDKPAAKEVETEEAPKKAMPKRLKKSADVEEETTTEE